MRRFRRRLLLLCTGVTLAGCTSGLQPVPVTQDLEQTLDDYGSFLGRAFVSSVHAAELEGVAAPAIQQELVFRANSLASPYVPPRWTTVATAIEELSCTGSETMVQCGFRLRVSLAAPNETGEVLQRHTTELRNEGQGWRVTGDDGT